jgi:hypothetical protein
MQSYGLHHSLRNVSADGRMVFHFLTARHRSLISNTQITKVCGFSLFSCFFGNGSYNRQELSMDITLY